MDVDDDEQPDMNTEEQLLDELEDNEEMQNEAGERRQVKSFRIKRGNAYTSGMTSVTPVAIAYCAYQVRQNVYEMGSSADTIVSYTSVSTPNLGSRQISTAIGSSSMLFLIGSRQQTVHRHSRKLKKKSSNGGMSKCSMKSVSLLSK